MPTPPTRTRTPGLAAPIPGRPGGRQARADPDRPKTDGARALPPHPDHSGIDRFPKAQGIARPIVAFGCTHAPGPEAARRPAVGDRAARRRARGRAPFRYAGTAPETRRSKARQQARSAKGGFMHIEFHGAAGGVTGSCHLVEAGGRRILVDCGMFQGRRELHEDNAADFGFDPAGVHVLLLTHAHLDHCGRIPLLVKRGFSGEIVATAATRDLTRLILLDSAHLHEEEARRRRHHGAEGAARAPLYDTIDALDAMERFGRVAAYGRTVDLGHGARATFFEAGHILGSASILLEVSEEGRHRRILFSGDIGPLERPLLNPPAPPAGADVVVMESTYGDRDHRDLQSSVDEFHAAIRAADARGGNVIIPTFALERAQELLFYLREGAQSGAIPKGLRVFLDSPMAISATRIFGRHPEAMKPGITAMIRGGTDPFRLPNLHMTREASESMALNRIRSGAVIMAGSGMCTGGRVRHHLRHNLAHRDCSVIFVGFAARGTLARIIVDGAKTVTLFGDEVPVRAHVHTINGFSAHAGQGDLVDWHRRTGTPEITFLVHGEDAPRETLAQRLPGTRTVLPDLHDRHPL
jgi:metallo-beta-lactamase family protein